MHEQHMHVCAVQREALDSRDGSTHPMRCRDVSNRQDEVHTFQKDTKGDL